MTSERQPQPPRPRQLPLFVDEDAGLTLGWVGPEMEGFRSRREAWRHRHRRIEVVARL